MRRFAEREEILITQKFAAVVTVSVLALSTLRAQDAKVVVDNLEFSREFYSGVHFSAIAESAPSFGYRDLDGAIAKEGRIILITLSTPET